MSIIKDKIILVIFLLSFILLILFLAVSSLTKKSQQSGKDSLINPQINRAENPDPTKTIPIISPIPTRTKVDLKLLTAQNYNNIIIEYRYRSQTYVIYYQGNEDQAKEEFGDFMKKNGIKDIRNLKTFYVSLDPLGGEDRFINQQK